MNHVEVKFLEISNYCLCHSQEDVQEYGGEEGDLAFGRGLLTMRPVEL